MRELDLTGEGFALVGQQDNTPQCQDCKERAFLIAGRCEPCLNAHNQALIEAEALQSTFFGKEVTQ